MQTKIRGGSRGWVSVHKEVFTDLRAACRASRRRTQFEPARSSTRVYGDELASAGNDLEAEPGGPAKAMAESDELILNSIYLKNRIAELGIKQWWLAEQVDVDRKTFIRWTQGKVKSLAAFPA